jgi:hypothetical protein
MRLSAKVGFFKAQTIIQNQHVFLSKSCFTSFGTLCRTTSLFTLTSSLAFQLLGSRSQHAVPAVL